MSVDGGCPGVQNVADGVIGSNPAATIPLPKRGRTQPDVVDRYAIEELLESFPDSPVGWRDRAIVELLRNAIRFSPEESTIHLAAIRQEEAGRDWITLTAATATRARTRKMISSTDIALHL